MSLHSDNTCKETKNNTVLRTCALLTALHRAKRCQLQKLQTGHSHEDIDQWFSVIDGVKEQFAKFHVPGDFEHILNSHFRLLESRRTEPEREAFIVDSVRVLMYALDKINIG